MGTEIIQENTEPLLFQPQQEARIMKILIMMMIFGMIKMVFNKILISWNRSLMKIFLFNQILAIYLMPNGHGRKIWRNFLFLICNLCSIKHFYSKKKKKKKKKKKVLCVD